MWILDWSQIAPLGADLMFGSIAENGWLGLYQNEVWHIRQGRMVAQRRLMEIDGTWENEASRPAKKRFVRSLDTKERSGVEYMYLLKSTRYIRSPENAPRTGAFPYNP